MNKAKAELRVREEATWKLRGQVLYQRKAYAKACREYEEADAALHESTREAHEQKSKLAVLKMEAHSARDEILCGRKALELATTEMESLMCELQHQQAARDEVARAAEEAREQQAELGADPGLRLLNQTRQELRETQQQLAGVTEERDGLLKQLEPGVRRQRWSAIKQMKNSFRAVLNSGIRARVQTWRGTQVRACADARAGEYSATRSAEV